MSLDCTVCQASGANADVIYAEETEWGVFRTLSSAWKGLRITPGESLQSQINRFQSNELQPVRAVLNTAGGNIRAGGSVNFELASEGFGTLFKHLLQGVPVVTGSIGDFCHTIKAGNDLPCGGISVEKRFNDVNKYIRYWGGRIDSATLNFPQEGYVTGSMNFLFKGELSDEAVTSLSSYNAVANTSDYGPTGISVSPAAPFSTDEPFVTFSSIIQEGNPLASVSFIRSATLNITNTYDAEGFVLGSRYRECVTPGRRNISGTVNIFFKDLTYYNKFLNETRSALRIYLVRGTKSFEFLLPRIEFTGESPKITAATGLTLNMPFQALYDSTEATDLKLTIRNTESSL